MSSRAKAGAKSSGGKSPRQVKSAAIIDDDDVVIAPTKKQTNGAVAAKRPKSPSISSSSSSAAVAATTSAKKPSSTPAKSAAKTSSASSSNTTTTTSATTGAIASTTTNIDLIDEKKKTLNPYRSSESIFTADDLKFFDDNGYIVLRNAVSREDCDAVVADIWQFLGFNPKKDGIDACYNAPLNSNALVEMYHSQAQWNNRCSPRIYNAFCELWRRDDLWVSLDRVGVKLPSVDKHPHYRNKGFTHWDFDITDDAEYFPTQFQGALALVDTDPSMGGFHCYPGMHKYLKQWMKESDIKIEDSAVKRFYSSGFPIKVPDFETTLRHKKHDVVEMKAGDLVIWRGELAHGNGENLSPRPRVAQYITMHPQRYDDEQLRAKRVECWRKRTPGGQVLWPQLPLENAHGTTGGRGTKPTAEQGARRVAELTELGKLLLGVEPWPQTQ